MAPHPIWDLRGRGFLSSSYRTWVETVGRQVETRTWLICEKRSAVGIQRSAFSDRRNSVSPQRTQRNAETYLSCLRFLMFKCLPPVLHLRQSHDLPAGTRFLSRRFRLKQVGQVRSARNPFRAESSAESFPHSAPMTMPILHPKAGCHAHGLAWACASKRILKQAGQVRSARNPFRAALSLARPGILSGPHSRSLRPESFPGRILCGILSAFGIHDDTNLPPAGRAGHRWVIRLWALVIPTRFITHPSTTILSRRRSASPARCGAPPMFCPLSS